MAPEVNHLWPLITHSSPSSSARVWSVVGSEPATSGSVIEKQLRMSPSSSGSQEALLLLGRCRARRGSPMLPVSGAAQLKAIGATIGLRPICSQRIPYSQLVRPGAELLVGQEEVPEALRLGPGSDLDEDLADRRPRASTSSSIAWIASASTG